MFIPSTRPAYLAQPIDELPNLAPVERSSRTPNILKPAILGIALTSSVVSFVASIPSTDSINLSPSSSLVIIFSARASTLNASWNCFSAGVSVSPFKTFLAILALSPALLKAILPAFRPPPISAPAPPAINTSLASTSYFTLALIASKATLSAAVTAAPTPKAFLTL